MTQYNTGLSPDEVAQTTANLELVSQFIEELLAAPEQFDVLGDSATLVLLPPDDPGDPELSAANIEMAKRLAAKGKKPTLWTVGMPRKVVPLEHTKSRR